MAELDSCLNASPPGPTRHCGAPRAWVWVSAAVFLVVAGDNPEQMSSAAAFATLCEVSPVGLSRERLCATASTGTAIARPIAPDGSLS